VYKQNEPLIEHFTILTRQNVYPLNLLVYPGDMRARTLILHKRRTFLIYNSEPFCGSFTFVSRIYRGPLRDVLGPLKFHVLARRTLCKLKIPQLDSQAKFSRSKLVTGMIDSTRPAIHFDFI
jgi:hypothetical protein